MSCRLLTDGRAREEAGQDDLDGRVEMTLRVTYLADVRNAVQRWGDHVEALAPAQLRSDLFAALDAARARYAER